MTKKIIESSENTSPLVLSIGDYILRVASGELYLLACTEYLQVALINLGDGQRWLRPTTVGDVFNLTEEEIEHLTDGFGEFSYIKEIKFTFVK